MTRLRALGALLTLLFTIWMAIPGYSQSPAAAGIDLEQWTRLADRAELVINQAAASDSALTLLREELRTWEERAIMLQGSLQGQVYQLESRIAVLEGSDDGGLAASDDIELRRNQLAAELAAAREPVLIAREVAQWSNGLVAGIDAIIEERSRTRFYTVGPIPLNPALWPEALGYLADHASSVVGEIRGSLGSEAQREKRRQDLPLLLGLLVAGGFLLTFARRLVRRFALVRRVDGGWAATAGAAVLERMMTGLVLPVAGIALISYAGVLADLFTIHVGLMTQTIPQMGLSILVAHWLGSVLFSDQPESLFSPRLGDGWTAAVRRLVIGLGWVVAGKLLTDSVISGSDALSATVVVVGYPVTMAASILLFLLARRLAEHFAGQTGDAGEYGIADSVVSLLVMLARIVSVVAALAATAGYSAVAEFLVFPSIQTLALYAVALSVQIILAEVLAQTRSRLGSGADDGRRNLMNVLAGAVVFAAAIPELAIIWGASDIQILEFWAMALDGVQIGGHKFTPGDFLTMIVVFVAGYMATRMMQSILSRSVLPNTDLEIGVQRAITTGSGYVGIVLAAVLAISLAGLDLTSLAIVAGALSVGIGFGLQAVVGNFVSGIILLIERPINVGDWIEAGGVSGTVTRISVRSTQIETFDRATVVVPNTDLMSGQVVNWTLTNRICRTIVPVGVAYGTDARRVERLLLEIAAEHPAVLKDPAPGVVFQRFGADALEFELRAILSDTNQILSAKSDLNFAIARRFEEEGISIPFPQRDIWIRNAGDALSIPETEPEPEENQK